MKRATNIQQNIFISFFFSIWIEIHPTLVTNVFLLSVMQIFYVNIQTVDQTLSSSGKSNSGKGFWLIVGVGTSSLGV